MTMDDIQTIGEEIGMYWLSQGLTDASPAGLAEIPTAEDVRFVERRLGPLSDAKRMRLTEVVRASIRLALAGY